MIAFFKKLFCRHNWERVYTGEGYVINGWLVRPCYFRCKNCGKVVEGWKP